MKKPSIIDKLMNEPIAMIGFPQIIVTRAFCYQFLKGCGWETGSRSRRARFDTADYAAFGRPTINAPLTDETERDYWLNQVRGDYLRVSPQPK